MHESVVLNNSPLQVNKLIKMKKEKLKKSLYKIKNNNLARVNLLYFLILKFGQENKEKKNQNLNNTISSFARSSLKERKFDGNRTFYPQFKSTRNYFPLIFSFIAMTVTLGGAFTNQKERSMDSESVVWGGNVFYNKNPQNFHRKRTFLTEWESAANNNGVFMNK